MTTTTVSTKGQIVLPATLRRQDRIQAGQRFEVETVLSADDAQNGPFRFLGKLSAADAQEARDDRGHATSPVM